MKVLIIGSSKSGKSEIAEKISYKLNKNGNLFYLATMKPYDKEDELRIKNHKKNREKYNFKTLEIQRDFEILKDNISENDTILFESVTSALTNNMFYNNRVINDAGKNVIRSLKKNILSFKNVIIVSDYIHSDSIAYDDITENYKSQLALVNTFLSKVCDVVIECSFSNIKIHKGKREYEKII
ncbi:bifunctional adenosylcobinamide kinase/adenosylcobinamide-phosphate guanylyltransferase [Clostridium sp. BJN0001]|uniref:bifunctional adenosylcobinamide kinase/adenosylcobinamide-phosphate guanylyltransferase n=1 Tax=Clostridium sp. BJN0001 TaxID=2930219 RepID=UPI001FCFA1D9|nr:bifunctional adenosylcobinamide kinase/adenosylcobinamide-phosphate guanylyltransferase [Clostridium sp. BJN0001]